MTEPERTGGHIPWSNVDRRLRSAREIVMHNGDGADPMIIKGDADLVTDPGELADIDRAYRK
ncbi:MAG TPA: hypothetical protein VGQ84_14295 [Gaiellaceae bacterium]|nr:hypothetical protein [Gaiellaceae bacterium]